MDPSSVSPFIHSPLTVRTAVAHDVRDACYRCEGIAALWEDQTLPVPCNPSRRGASRSTFPIRSRLAYAQRASQYFSNATLERCHLRDGRRSDTVGAPSA